LSGLQLTLDQRLWFIEQVNACGASISDLARRYNLNAKTITSWARNHRQGRPIHCGKGRPLIITEGVKQRVKSVLQGSTYKLQKHEFAETVQEAVDGALKEAGIATELRKKLSHRSLGRVEAALDIGTTKAEYTTGARADATASIRNFVSHAVMVFHQLHMRNVPGRLVLNSDGSCYTVGYRNNKIVEVKILKTEEEVYQISQKYCQTLPSKGDANIGAYTIKYYAFIGAMGSVFDPIFIIQDEDMGAEDMDVYEVPGLGVSTHVDTKGYIVFMNSRAGNIKFFTWFMEEIVVGVVKHIKQVHHRTVAADAPAFLQLDGEPIQIACLKSASTLEKLAAHNIDVGKSFHSGTAVAQPCDAGNLFRGSKAVNKSLHNFDVDDRDVHNDVKQVIKSHNIKMNASATGSKQKQKGLTARHVTMASMGIMRIAHSLAVATNKRTVIQSFKATGNYPYDLNRILSNFRGPPITMAQRDIIKNVFPTLVARYATAGELSEKDYDELNIPKDPKEGGKSRDIRVIYQRRSLLFTHPSVQSKEHAMELEKREQALQAQARRAKRALSAQSSGQSKRAKTSV
jgi:transposase